uniref:Uncharacterized protein n=1 Tax=Cannabis sativa TaxID=3483 RepID=A0A803Q8H1_CANSA
MATGLDQLEKKGLDGIGFVLHARFPLTRRDPNPTGASASAGLVGIPVKTAPKRPWMRSGRTEAGSANDMSFWV